MKKFILSGLLAILSFVSFSQTSQLFISGHVENEYHEKIKNCHLQLFQDDILVAVDTTDTNGAFHLDSLPVGHVYDLYFEVEGYSLKFVRIDLKNADPSDITKFPLIIDMALFSTDGIKPEKLYFLQSEPYAKAAYDKEKDNIVWDMTYLEKMKKKVEAVRQ